MQNRTHLFTSEAVSEGHPDKLADQISDAVLDAFLARDPNARVACETLLADQFVVVAGEFKPRMQPTSSPYAIRLKHWPAGCCARLATPMPRRALTRKPADAGALQPAVQPHQPGRGWIGPMGKSAPATKG